MREATTLACAALIALGLSSPGHALDEPGAVRTVEAFHATAREAMQHADELGYAGRRALFEPAVNDSFDIALIAQVVMGQHWQRLQPEQREALIEALRRLTISRYAWEFDGFGGERFETLEERPLSRGRVLVRTEIVRPSDDDVSLDYVLRHVDGRWRIVNVVAEGVSDLALKRSEYGSIIDDKGFAYLLEKLAEQAAGYEREPSS